MHQLIDQNIEMLLFTEICFIHKGLCWKYHDLDQNIKNFHVMTLNGRRLSFEI